MNKFLLFFVLSYKKEIPELFQNFRLENAYVLLL